MNFIKCKLCREPFNSFGSPICPSCMEQLDKDFFVVRDYIYDHPNQSSVEKIAEATGIAEKNIVYLLEDGRLSIQNGLEGAFGGLGSNLKCKICGRPITSGTMCENCKGALTKEFDSASALLESKKPANSSYVSPRIVRQDLDKPTR